MNASFTTCPITDITPEGFADCMDKTFGDDKNVWLNEGHSIAQNDPSLFLKSAYFKIVGSVLGFA